MGVAAWTNFACQIPFKYSKCHRVASASAFVVGNDFVTAISICLTVCLVLRLLSCCCCCCCCQEVVAGCHCPAPFLYWLATICLLLPACQPALHHFVFIIISTNFNKLQSTLDARLSSFICKCCAYATLHAPKNSAAATVH